jgi:uncharacterized protein with HEPN domain
VRTDADANRAYLALALEHLKRAIQYSDRGRSAVFDESNPDTFLLVEGELRKGCESLNRLGQSFWVANSTLDGDRIGEIRQQLTHDYADVSREFVWQVVRKEAPRLARLLIRIRVPKDAEPG